MKTTFYVQLKPKWYRWGSNDRLEGISAVRVSTKKPDKPVVGSITIKLTVNVPESLFKPFMPKVEIEIPEDLAQQNIEVTAEDANTDE